MYNTNYLKRFLNYVAIINLIVFHVKVRNDLDVHAGYVVPFHQVVGGELGVSISYSIPVHSREDSVLRGPRSSSFWVPRNLSHHMDRQARIGDTVER